MLLDFYSAHTNILELKGLIFICIAEVWWDHPGARHCISWHIFRETHITEKSVGCSQNFRKTCRRQYYTSLYQVITYL